MEDNFPITHFRVGAFQSRHYPRAPIIEAIIGFNVELPVGFHVDELRRFQERIAENYPGRAEERTLSVVATTSAPIPTNEITGFRFTSSDGKYVAVCRANAFRTSRLAPYEDWETFETEVRRLWGLFKETFSPVKVTGLSVRYINRIEIPRQPEAFLDFRWYFRTFPEVSADLDVGMSTFSMRLDIPLRDIRAHLILNQSLLPAAPDQKTTSVLLDADVVSSFAGEKEDHIWERFGVLRKAKNDVFESCITNLTRELFQ